MQHAKFKCQMRALVAIGIASAALTSAPAAAQVAAPAADCPTALTPGRTLRLLDDHGHPSLIAWSNGQFVRRTEDYRQQTGPKVNFSDAFQGLFTESFTVIGDNFTNVQLNKLRNADFEKLKNFLPLKVGSKLVLDSESVVLIDSTRTSPAQFAQPNQRVRSTLTVLRDEVVAAGPCRYKTNVVEVATSLGDGTVGATTTYHYQPQLKAWLRLHVVAKTAGQPDNVLDRTVVSVSVASP